MALKRGEEHEDESRKAVELLAVCDLLDPGGASKMTQLYALLTTAGDGGGAYWGVFRHEIELLGGDGAADAAVRLQRYRRIPGAHGQGGMTHTLIDEGRFAEALREIEHQELRLAGRDCMIDWGWGIPSIAGHRQAQIAALLGSGKRGEVKRLVRLPAVWAINPDHAIALHRSLADAGLEEEADHVPDSLPDGMPHRPGTVALHSGTFAPNQGPQPSGLALRLLWKRT